MGYWNLDGVYVCECICSQCEDSYFYEPRRRSTIFAPPNLADFLQEIASGTSACPEVRAAQEREERARQRATSADGTLSIGETAPRPLFRPKSLYWPLLSLLLTPVARCVAASGAPEKAPRASPTSWFDPKEAHANEHEVLFYKRGREAGGPAPGGRRRRAQHRRYLDAAGCFSNNRNEFIVHLYG